jgi:putative ABC transport system permease protein
MSQPPHRRFFQLPWRPGARIRADVDEELSFALDMRAAELVEQGVPEADARNRALAEFGDIEVTRRYCTHSDIAAQRSERRVEWLAELAQDARLASRGMRRSPGFALVVLITLALGIGANTAVYSVVRKIVLEQLPYSRPDRLVRLYGATARNPDAHARLTPAEVADLQRSAAFAAVTPIGFYSGLTYVGADRTEMWSGVEVGPDFFHVLGTRALLGRTLDERDTAPDAAPVVVLSYGLWQRTFGGDSSIVGRDVRLNGQARTVVGVMPPDFIPPERTPEAWTPLDMRRVFRDPVAARQSRAFGAVGRLADGIDPTELRAALDLLDRRAREKYPELRDLAPMKAVPLHDDLVKSARPRLLVVMGAAALVLLIACVNVAGLFLSRITARRRELAVRAALGAGRGRLVRQLLTESAILGLAGGALGVGLAFWGKNLLVEVAKMLLPAMDDVPMDAGVLAFAVAISLLSALASGMVPALAGTRFGLHGSLAESSRGSAGGRSSSRTGRALVVMQVALAVVLLIGAGLLGRTLATLERTGVGFDTGTNLLTFGVALSHAKYADESRQTAFFDELRDGIRSLPTVRSVATVVVSPWNGYTAGGPDSISIAGQAAGVGGLDMASQVTVSDSYFTTMGIPVRRGREFTPLDRENSPLVAVVSESVARRFWPGTSPLGQLIRVGGQRAPFLEVVGVAGDVRARPDEDVEPTVYVPMRQHPQGFSTVVVRTNGNSMAIVPAVQRILHEMDPELPLVGAKTLRDEFDGMLGGQRLPMFFVTAFAALALVLAALGVYSIMAYAVTARRREFGIRTALGARSGSVLALVLRQGMAMAIAGTVVGLLVAAWATRVLAGLLVGVAPRDPVTFAVTAIVLLGASCAACLIPARRATRVDPVEALRAE